jgi:hypothetical protein
MGKVALASASPGCGGKCPRAVGSNNYSHDIETIKSKTIEWLFCAV